ncbi:MAG TPA: PAS domain S-box protein, partial [Aliidongia sp.]|nr:PAS domain S-box protein [Aliidongia sp.]
MTSKESGFSRRNVRRAALFELADQLRNLTDPAMMAFVAAQIVGRVLKVGRAGYGTIDAAGQILDVERDWAQAGMVGLAGRHRFQPYGSAIGSLKRGEPVIFADVERDARTAASTPAWMAVGTRSVVNLPILEHGELVAVFFVHHALPRSWPRPEIDFIHDVADRTHAAIQRGRAEGRLRALATSLERQVAERTADRNRLWQLSTDIMLVARFDGIMIAVNPAWTRVLGWTEQELIGRSLFDLIHPDDAEKTKQNARNLAAGATLSRCDNRFRHKNGSYRWIGWTAVPSEGAINAVGRDFTSEKETMDALERSEAQMRSVFESSYQYQGLATIDGILIDANPTSLAGIEASLEDVLDQYLWETPWFTGTPGIPEQIRAAVPRVACGLTVRREIVLNLPTGQRALDFSMRPLFSRTGEVMAIVFEAIELTERRAAEEQLRQAQKMEAIGQLTGGIAHDFNNLLTGISGSLEMLKIRIGKERFAEIERYVSTAQGAASRAAALTQRLLAFSRRQMLDPKPTQVNALIAGMADLIQRTVGPQIIVETTLDDGLWLTSCDQHQLENAILNLCINARDAMPDGGHLTIGTSNRPLDGKEPVRRDLVPGDYVSIRVTDTGSGMSPAIIARAFDPFFTT